MKVKQALRRASKIRALQIEIKEAEAAIAASSNIENA